MFVLKYVYFVYETFLLLCIVYLAASSLTHIYASTYTSDHSFMLWLAHSNVMVIFGLFARVSSSVYRNYIHRCRYCLSLCKYCAAADGFKFTDALTGKFVVR